MAITKSKTPKTPANKRGCCIIRCRDAGVHFGQISPQAIKEASRTGLLAVRDSRRLWYWISKATLSELATFGPLQPGKNRYGCVLPKLTLRLSDVCEIIPCTAGAATAIHAVGVWEAQ
jgi:hypothetical protein